GRQSGHTQGNTKRSEEGGYNDEWLCLLRRVLDGVGRRGEGGQPLPGRGSMHRVAGLVRRLAGRPGRAAHPRPVGSSGRKLVAQETWPTVAAACLATEEVTRRSSSSRRRPLAPRGTLGRTISMHALVIDDARVVRMLLRGAMQQLGFEVTEAGDGAE